MIARRAKSPERVARGSSRAAVVVEGRDSLVRDASRIPDASEGSITSRVKV
jgi:hypothetical protein